MRTPPSPARDTLAILTLALAAGLAGAPRLGAQAFDPCGSGCATVPIACGGSVAGELTAGDCAQEGRLFDLYEWQTASSADTVLTVHATGFTPRLVLAAPPDAFPCRQIREGTDACAPGDASTTCIEFPITPGRRLLVLVTSVEEGGKGSYTFEIACAPKRCDPACKRGSLACGGEASGKLSEESCATNGVDRLESWDLSIPPPAPGGGQLSRLRLSVEASAPVTVGIHSEDIFGLGSCIELVSAPACSTGGCIDVPVIWHTYHVAVSGPVGATYTLGLVCDPFDACRECPPAGAIVCGETREGQLGPESCQTFLGGDANFQRRDRYTLSVAEAGYYDVRIESAGRKVSWSILDTACGFSPVGWSEACDDPAAPDLGCSVLRLEAGEYLLEVASSARTSGEAPVPYTLEVTCRDLRPCGTCPVQPIGCGPFQSYLGPAACTDNDGNPIEMLLFDVPSPDTLDVQLQVDTDPEAGFHPRVRLLDRFCNLIAEGAACPGGAPTSACVSVRLPPFSNDARVYLLVSADPEGPPFGEYQVLTSCEPFTPCAPDCDKGTARPGEDIHGELTPRSCSADGIAFFDSWTLDIPGPILLDLDVQGEGFSPVVSLRAQDPGCSPMGSGPSRPDGFSRLLRRLDPGSYTVVVTSGTGAAQKTGPYTLRVRSRGCPPCAASTSLACAPEAKLAGTLEAGDCVDADGYLMDIASLEVTALTNFSINTSDAEPPYFLLYRDGCALDVSFRPAANVALTGYLKPGTYTIVVLGYRPGPTGAYSIGFPCNLSAYCRQECEAGTLEPEILVEGSLTTEDCQERLQFVDTWRFSVPEGAGASVFDFPTPPGTSVFFSVFSGACDREIDLTGACERLPPPLGGGWSCALEPGDYRLAISQQSFVIQQRGPLDYGIHLSIGDSGGPPTGLLPGDCTGDGAVDLGDGICLLGYLFLGELHGFPCAEEGPTIPGFTDSILLDWDGNSVLNITDVVRLVNHLFMGGPGHIQGDTCQPFPGCPPGAFNCRG